MMENNPNKMQDSVWDRPYIFKDEIAPLINGANIATKASFYGFRYNHDQKLLLKTKYDSLRQAILGGEIIDKGLEVYYFVNPTDSKEYVEAVNKLVELMYLFPYEGSIFLTRVGLEKHYGITKENIISFKEKLQKFVNQKRIFSIHTIQQFMVNEPLSQFETSMDYYSNIFSGMFTNGLVKKKILGTGKNDVLLFYTKRGEEPLKILFDKLFENGAKSMNIYDIRDMVYEMFGVEYNLDWIGSNAEKAGYYYSDEMECVYPDIHDFYKEIKV